MSYYLKFHVIPQNATDSFINSSNFSKYWSSSANSIFKRVNSRVPGAAAVLNQNMNSNNKQETNKKHVPISALFFPSLPF